MSRKRASLLTIKSLTALSKVCSSTSSTKTLFFLKNLSTASQRLEIQDPNFNGYPVENSVQPYQNTSHFQQHPNAQPGSYPNEGLRSDLRNDVGNDSFGENWSFRYDVNGSHQSFGGAYRERNWSESQNDPVEKNGNFGGDFGNSDQQSGHQYGEVHAQNSWGAQASSNWVGGGNGNGNGEQFQHNHNPYAGQYQQLYQQNANDGQHWPNSNHLQNEVEGSQVSNNPTSTLEELDGFCKEGKVKEAMEVLKLLEEASVPVDLPRFVQLMRVCGNAQALEEAKVVHQHILRSLSPLMVSTCNKILEMYWKCGSTDDAFDVFDKMEIRNLTSWDTMIKWLSKSGLGEDAIDIFTQFKQSGLRPDAQMFIGVFSACDVVGDINEGMLHFESMRKDYSIVPSMEHYVSIVDMMGSNGYLDEALEFIQKMSMEPSVLVWETLMNLCRVQGHLELGDRCAELIEQLEPSYLSEQAKSGLVPVKAIDPSKERERNSSSQNILDIKSKVHEFKAGDRSQPELYILLRSLKEQMKEAGYVAETRVVLHDIDQESKEEAILAHSERLASAQAFLTSPARSPIRVIKNLRVCVDCHNAIKIMSKIVGRQMIMRDAKRFHHFENGVCSCRDYW